MGLMIVLLSLFISYKFIKLLCRLCKRIIERVVYNLCSRQEFLADLKRFERDLIRMEMLSRLRDKENSSV
ncbi:hypothetical protein BCO_0011201 (plasmid) [Borrelia coriaceae ATCC 43381]|uniref:Uncharacterized protein n=1 Tax=Borrelia coriaceae ATCC 43381 TaxID=1408429 RepID=W5T2D8_9SPIR|nr:hypothetical protein [Borrelia coriaceae]AHH11481.1 hypothetical protein BCO_0011201 [Borrelia coriaceae ATCC 43381]